jgi:hypothetical protein
VVVEGSPLQLPAVPDEDGCLAVLEEDICRGVTFGKFLLNLVVKGIFLVFALPVSPVLTKGIFQRAVRIDDCTECGPVLQLQDQFDLLVGAVLFQKFLEGGANGGFVPGTAVLHNLFDLTVILLNE